jgi:hypothetical protein
VDHILLLAPHQRRQLMALLRIKHLKQLALVAIGHLPLEFQQSIYL